MVVVVLGRSLSVKVLAVLVGVVEARVLGVADDEVDELVVMASHCQVVNAHAHDVVVVPGHKKIAHVRLEVCILGWLRLLRVVVDLVVVAHQVEATDIVLHKDLVVVAGDLESLLLASDASVLVVGVDYVLRKVLHVVLVLILSEGLLLMLVRVVVMMMMTVLVLICLGLSMVMVVVRVAVIRNLIILLHSNLKES